MKAFGALLAGIALFAAHQPLPVCADTESIDLKALAQKARPAVMLLVVSDANGKKIAAGTGFLVSSDGKLITNRHGIKNNATIIATASNGAQFSVLGLLAEDAEHDLVLLKIDREQCPYLSPDFAEKVMAEQRVIVVGGSRDAQGMVFQPFNLVDEYRWMELDVKTMPGQSGSPVLNDCGELIGVVCGQLSDKPTHTFAIMVEAVKRLVKNAGKTAPVKPFSSLARKGEDELYNDEDYKAALTASLRNDNNEAIRRIKMVITRFPNSAAAHILWGSYCEHIGLYDEAVLAYRTALVQRPDVACSWAYLGGVLAGRREYDHAATACKQAITLEPDCIGAWLNLGAAYVGLKQYPKAWEVVNHLHKLDPVQARKLEEIVQKASPR